MMTNEELYRQIQAGDTAAFERLYRQLTRPENLGVKIPQR